MMYKETAVSLVSKDELAFVKDRDGFIDYIAKQLSQSLADKLIAILDKEAEVIVKRSEIRAFEYIPTNSIEYKQQIEWSPLIRCKDCKKQKDCKYPAKWNYCPDGERREDNDAKSN